MPQLQDLRKELKLPIKSIKGSEIILKDGILAGDMGFVYGDPNTNDVERTLRALSKMIVKWNLTDKDGKELPINLENIGRLDVMDITGLIEVTSFGEDKKKGGILKK
jgi:hypothetical protein